MAGPILGYDGQPVLVTGGARGIGAAVMFLMSPLARSITNQAIAVDGGWSIT